MGSLIESDPIIRYVVDSLKKFDPDKIFLFGSRSRDDFHEKSDYDFAFSGGKKDLIPNVLVDLIDNSPTLKGINVVNLDEVGPRLREKVYNEGVVLYAKEGT